MRLVYADWLDERGDTRAEFVRLQVKLREVSTLDPTRILLHTHEQELRTTFDPYWIAKLDPPVWCILGNIVDERIAGSEEVPRRGTKLFRPNAKVFLASRSHWHVLLDGNARRATNIEVVGQHRKSRKWIGSWVLAHATTNWRVRLIHHPGALVRLREAGWPGFRLQENQFECPAERKGEEAIRSLMEAISLV